MREEEKDHRAFWRRVEAELGSSRRRGLVQKRNVSDLVPSFVVDEGLSNNMATPVKGKRPRTRQTMLLGPAEISAYQSQGIGVNQSVLLGHACKAAALDLEELLLPMDALQGTAASRLDPAPPCPPAVTNNATANVNSSSSSSSSSSDSEVEAGMEQLSSYERKRLRNIRENAKFLADLNIQKAVESLKEVNKRSHRSRVKVKQPPLPLRKPSRRLRKLDPSGVPLPEEQPLLTPAESHVLRASGPLKMEATNLSTEEQNALLEVWRKSEQIVETDGREPCGSAWLLGLRQGNCRIAKVMREKICSVAVHPTMDHVLVAAGDSQGNVVFWDLDSSPGEAAAVTLFRPHVDRVSCLCFPPTQRTRLYSSSLDDSLRCADLHHGVFDEVYAGKSSPPVGLTSFDFQSEDGASLLVGRCDGAVELVDCRSPRKCGEQQWMVHQKRVHSVHVHPTQRHYFVTASTDCTVQIHDVRAMGVGQRSGTAANAVAVLQQHSRVVHSAYFSPLTGSRLLTTSIDNSMHVYDTRVLGSQITRTAKICHNNHTGRWLVPMRAMWVPGGEDMWMCGSMEWPRHLDVFSATGQKLLVVGKEEISSICTVITFHPTRPVLVACNSSGKVHLFAGLPGSLCQDSAAGTV
ncbi:WD repeat-containing protein 76 isoform X3 [Lethenteron reissneri]|uniref:WD repeat-containing protein 76 isoform X3 n=1 Tax=Lethenteron reissneri TaxID=7753 RepID=UPI002AB5FC78|nr:WD repeat-containing protein 76 isoform X3 [Lethenteron reissneri]